MILNGILKGDYQGLLDVIACEIPRPTFARLKPTLRGICRLPPAPKLRRGNGADRKAQFAA